MSTQISFAFLIKIQKLQKKIKYDINFVGDDYMFEKKKRIIIAIVTVVVIAIIAIIAMNLVTSAKKAELTKLDEITSPDNNYLIVINQVGYPISFDSHNVKIQLIDNKTIEEIKVIEEDISNDGKNLTSDNWEVEWLEEDVVITLIGEQQNNEEFKIQLK